MRLLSFGIFFLLAGPIGAAELSFAAFQKTEDGWIPQPPSFIDASSPTVSFYFGKKGRVEARPFRADQNEWKATMPTESVLERGRDHFLKAVQKAIACDEQGNSIGPIPEPEKMTEMLGSYRSKNNEWLIGFRLTGNTCEGPMEPEWANHWYWILGDQLRSLGRDLRLLHLGDYDGDGFSEALFQTHRDTEMHYWLLYDRFRKKAEFVAPAL